MACIPAATPDEGGQLQKPTEHKTAGPQNETSINLSQEQRTSFGKFTVWSRS